MSGQKFPVSVNAPSTFMLPLVEGVRDAASAPVPLVRLARKLAAASPASAPRCLPSSTCAPAACAQHGIGGARTPVISGQHHSRRPLPLRPCQSPARAVKVGPAVAITRGPTKGLEARSSPGVQTKPFRRPTAIPFDPAPRSRQG